MIIHLFIGYLNDVMSFMGSDALGVATRRFVAKANRMRCRVVLWRETNRK